MGRFDNGDARYSDEERDEIVREICRRLAIGGTSLNVIRSELNPPLAKMTLHEWRKKDVEIANAIDEAFETGSDRMAGRMRQTARGKKESEGGDSSGNVKRDRLALWWDDKLLQRWDARYRQTSTTVLANDPVNPVTDSKPADLTDDQLLRIAARAAKATPKKKDG